MMVRAALGTELPFASAIANGGFRIKQPFAGLSWLASKRVRLAER